MENPIAPQVEPLIADQKKPIKKNRMNRKKFILDIVLINIISSIFSITVIIPLICLFMTFERVKKRCHDFGNNGTSVIISMIIYYIILGYLGFAFIMPKFLWATPDVTNTFDFLLAWVGFLTLLPLIVLSTIPGDAWENTYGENPAI